MKRFLVATIPFEVSRIRGRRGGWRKKWKKACDLKLGRSDSFSLSSFSMTDVLDDVCYCLSVLLAPAQGYAWSPREGFLFYRTVISCLQQRDRHQSTGMYLFREQTRASHLETREGTNCITPLICYS